MAKVDFVKIDEARFVEVCRLYFIWKDLNNSIKSWTSRGGGLMSR
ncbi:Bsp6I family restriction endonuclease [Campylobacter hyointestinalis]|uniref:Bsp6I family restriction endonuclease n=1 Tax=Campylobacter hyointestinalis TaxID=198 RepID=A0A562X7E9_CAMHY|nr:Bsp6I family type II restriction endonuclease [Campylobacter hyointestinalis]TWO18037.1 Bsp6I family restriction endonuclease [Campylobacter hyointestinalis]